ncbi:hypothetical protein LAZ29_03175 [Cereibacter sphaeroides]|uniref:hypothetical protein n=1 Tax=Cereibacter sphaeroides TaxID=1063 RepID=UPI001F28ACD4|nr:hypothetical protein [Cereibacter sphaeroides]MCE6949926.1 hypothetical protein [Cereibacter sphaeroides]
MSGMTASLPSVAGYVGHREMVGKIAIAIRDLKPIVGAGLCGDLDTWMGTKALSGCRDRAAVCSSHSPGG